MTPPEYKYSFVSTQAYVAVEVGMVVVLLPQTLAGVLADTLESASIKSDTGVAAFWG